MLRFFLGIFIFSFFFVGKASGQNNWNFSLEAGIVGYHIEMGGWGNGLNGPFVNDLTFPILISGRMSNTRLNSSLQISAHRNLQVLPLIFYGNGNSYSYQKQQFDVMYWYDMKKVSVGIGYTHMLFGHSYLQGRPNYDHGISLGFTYYDLGVPIELRKDIAYDFYWDSPDLFEFWSFRTWTPILTTKADSQERQNQNHLPLKPTLRLGLGARAGINPYTERLSESSPFVVIPYWESAIFIPGIRTQVYFQKGVWNFNRAEVGQLKNTGFSEFNYLGASYFFPLSKDPTSRYLRVGLSHGWITESLFDWQELPQANRVVYQNKAISLDLGYPLVKNLEATLKADYYYASSEFNTTGINWDRVRIGIRAYPFQ